MSKILNFREVKKPITVINKSTTRAEMLIYGDIGGPWSDSVRASEFSKALSELPKTVNEIDIRISSLGGDVFDGIAIYNRLVNHKAKVNVYVDSIAASIASIIAMAGDNIYMGEGAEIMIHDPWTFAAGNSRDLMATIDRLDDVAEQLVSIYQKNTGLGRSEIKQLMADETFFDSKQSVEMGFATAKMDEADTLNFAASLNPDRATWMRNKPVVNNYKETVNSGIDEILKDIEGYL